MWQLFVHAEFNYLTLKSNEMNIFFLSGFKLIITSSHNSTDIIIKYLLINIQNPIKHNYHLHTTRTKQTSTILVKDNKSNRL